MGRTENKIAAEQLTTFPGPVPLKLPRSVSQRRRHLMANGLERPEVMINSSQNLPMKLGFEKYISIPNSDLEVSKILRRFSMNNISTWLRELSQTKFRYFIGLLFEIFEHLFRAWMKPIK